METDHCMLAVTGQEREQLTHHAGFVFFNAANNSGKLTVAQEEEQSDMAYGIMRLSL